MAKRKIREADDDLGVICLQALNGALDEDEIREGTGDGK